ncbi:MAG: hypothetical protein WCW87_02705 [Candidatus Paceibacterota bacterium]
MINKTSDGYVPNWASRVVLLGCALIAFVLVYASYNAFKISSNFQTAGGVEMNDISNSDF